MAWPLGLQGRGADGGVRSPGRTGSCLAPAEQEQCAALWGMQPEPLLAAGARGWAWPRLESVCPWVEVWRAAGLLEEDGERRPLQVGGEEGANRCHVLSG